MTRKAKVRWLILVVPLTLWGLSFLFPWTAAQEISAERVVGVRSAYGFLGIGWMKHTEQIPPEEIGIRAEEEWFFHAYSVTPEDKLREFLDEAEHLPTLQFLDTANVELTGHPYQSKVLLWSFSERYHVNWYLVCSLVILGLVGRVVQQARRSSNSEP